MTQLVASSPSAAQQGELVHGFDVVTGAGSYSGAAIARRLHEAGRPIRTLTGHPSRGHADPSIEVRPLDFDDPIALSESLRGATTLVAGSGIFADPNPAAAVRRYREAALTAASV